MASSKQKLSVPLVRSALPRAGRYVIRDSETPLRLMVTPKGHKSYQVIKRVGAKVHVVTLGDAYQMTLADARKEATGTMAELAKGRDLNAEKRSQRKAATMAEAFEVFSDGQLASKSARYRRETDRVFEREILPVLGNQKLADVGRGALLAMLSKKAKPTPAMAALIQRTLRAFFSWCVQREYIAENPLAGASPVASVAARERVLSLNEIQSILGVSDGLRPRIRSLLLSLMLTAQRTREVSGMRWEDLDLGKAVWMLPAASTKNGLALSIPLPKALVNELATLPQTGPFVFGIGKPADPWSNLKSGLDRRLVEAGHVLKPWTFHDFRRTCASLLAEHGVPVVVADRLLNHKATATLSGVMRVYQRYEFLEERRSALELWARLVLGGATADPT